MDKRAELDELRARRAAEEKVWRKMFFGHFIYMALQLRLSCCFYVWDQTGRDSSRSIWKTSANRRSWIDGM